MLALAACGGDEEIPSPTVVDPGTGVTSLELRLDPDGPGAMPEQTEAVDCGGASAADNAACRAIEGLPADPLAPVPPNVPCTEIYGGPDVVTIRGTLRGKEVEGKLTRANGCEIERFERFLPVLEALFPGYRPGAAIQP